MFHRVRLLTFTALTLSAYCQAGEIEEVAGIAQRYGWQREVRLDDGTRVDLLTTSYAIEVDWEHKWAEGIGQALFYAIKTGREPAVLLLKKQGNTTDRYTDRCLLVCKQYQITLLLAYEGKATITTLYGGKKRSLPDSPQCP